MYVVGPNYDYIVLDIISSTSEYAEKLIAFKENNMKITIVLVNILTNQSVRSKVISKALPPPPPPHTQTHTHLIILLWMWWIF